jgi:O-antigen/teichoic acid export membrane protein
VLDRLRQTWRKSLVRNTVWMLLGHASRVGLQAAYFVLAARILGAQGLGVFSGALALAKILAPFSAWSSDEVLVRRVSQEDDAYPEALGNALLIIAVSGTLFTLAAGAISHWLFAGKVSLAVVALIGSAELVFYRLQMLVRRAFQAYERLNVTAVFKAAPSVTLLAAIIGFYFTSPTHDVEVWGWWYFGAMLVVAAIGAVVMFRELGRPVFAPRAAWRQLYEGFFFALSEACKTTYTDADKILLLRLVSREVAGVYKAGYRILSVLMIPVLALMDAAYARFFRTGVHGVRGSYGFAMRLMPLTVIYASVVAAGLYLAAPLMPMVLGKGYEETVSVVRWLAPILVIQAVSYLLMQTLTGGGHQRARSLTQLVVAIGNVAGNAVLIPLYWWRASAAVAVATELLLAILVFVLCRYTARLASPTAEGAWSRNTGR